MKIFTFSNERLTSAGLLVLRIGLGSIMLAHGAQKVLGIWGGHGLDATITGMSTMMGIPVWIAALSPFAEFLGGIFILFGALTRFFGIAVLINMLVAVLAVHLKNGFFAPTGFEYPGMLAIAALALTITGPGRYSVDSLFASSPIKVPKPSGDFIKRTATPSKPLNARPV